jgi:hypothetical protein
MTIQKEFVEFIAERTDLTIREIMEITGQREPVNITPSGRKRVCELIVGDLFKACIMSAWFRVEAIDGDRMRIATRHVFGVDVRYHKAGFQSHRSQQWVHIK